MLRIPPTTDPTRGAQDGPNGSASANPAVRLSRRAALGGILAVAGCASGPYTNGEYMRRGGPSSGAIANPAPPAAPSGPGASATNPQPMPPLPSAPPSGLTGALGYRLGPNDRVRITVFGEDRLSGEFVLDGEGLVSLPLIGTIRARNATTDELSQAVRDALAGRFILNPRVAVEVTSYRPFFILGEVNEPGEYPFSSGLTVLGAVALAKGFTVRANEGVAEISRVGSTRAFRARITPSTAVNPGDVITIPQRWF